MKRKPRSRKEKIWHEWLARHGCAVCGSDCNVHHAVGSHGVHNKVHIGGFFCVPLCPAHHFHPNGIHGDLSAFAGHGLGETRKEIEKTIFRRLVATYRRQHGEYPVPADVIAAIEGYHR